MQERAFAVVGMRVPFGHDLGVFLLRAQAARFCDQPIKDAVGFAAGTACALEDAHVLGEGGRGGEGRK